MSKKRIGDTEGREAIRRFRLGSGESSDEAMAVRYLLQLLQTRAPGSSVEVRIPPWAAVQVISGPQHSRGVPSAVVEMTPEIWIGVATGKLTFQTQLLNARISASGQRSNLSEFLPLLELP